MKSLKSWYPGKVQLFVRVNSCWNTILKYSYIHFIWKETVNKFRRRINWNREIWIYLHPVHTSPRSKEMKEKLISVVKTSVWKLNLYIVVITGTEAGNLLYIYVYIISYCSLFSWGLLVCSREIFKFNDSLFSFLIFMYLKNNITDLITFIIFTTNDML